jgi:hypothetical protein
MLELEIFVSIVQWRQSQEHDRKNIKKTENKLLIILDKTSKAVCLR